MKKYLIALAVAAALPVAAQADTTFSGSVTGKLGSKGAADTDASLKIATEEVLSNGLTAGVNFTIIGGSKGKDENQGTAFLKGDFFGMGNEGEFKAGSIDSDGAFQHGDVADVVANTEDADEEGTTKHGMKYTSGEFGSLGLTVALQLNAADGPGTDTTTDTVEARGTQFGLSIKPIEGLTLGYAMSNHDADNGGTITNSITSGVNEETYAYGAKYETGPFVFTLGKQENIGAKATAKYTFDQGLEGLYVKLEHDDSYTRASTKTDNRSQVTIGYGEDGDNGLVMSAKRERKTDRTKVWEATIAYKLDNLTSTAKRKKTEDREYSVALVMGNADLTFKHVDKHDKTKEDTTTLEYKVAF